MKIKVATYSGFMADERPERFILDKKELRVTDVLGRCRTPDSESFRVRADDGRVYTLARRIADDGWELLNVREDRADREDRANRDNRADGDEPNGRDDPLRFSRLRR